MAAWPETLPQSPLVEGFVETPADNTLRTQMDAGPAKLRRRSTAGAATLALNFLMDAAQLAALDVFYADTLQGGALNGGYFRASLELEVLP